MAQGFFRGLISADLCWQEKLAESSLFLSIFSCFPCILAPSLPGETPCKVTNVKQILQHVYNIWAICFLTQIQHRYSANDLHVVFSCHFPLPEICVKLWSCTSRVETSHKLSKSWHNPTQEWNRRVLHLLTTDFILPTLSCNKSKVVDYKAVIEIPWTARKAIIRMNAKWFHCIFLYIFV